MPTDLLKDGGSKCLMPTNLLKDGRLMPTNLIRVYIHMKERFRVCFKGWGIHAYTCMYLYACNYISTHIHTLTHAERELTNLNQMEEQFL